MASVEETELNSNDRALFDFLINLKIVKFIEEKRIGGGPVQCTSPKSNAFQQGLTIMYPLPWPTFSGKNLNKIVNYIMNQIEKWGTARCLERFGCVVPGDCPLLLIGLRSIS